MAPTPLRWVEGAYVLGLSLLVGAQLAVGYLVAPTLFAVVPERALAGTIAGAIFTRLGWIALAGYALLMLLQAWLDGAAAAPAARWPRRRVWVISAMIESAISSGVMAPRSSPAGALTRASASGACPAATSLSNSAAILRRLPMKA